MPIYALNGLRPTLPEGFCWIAETAVLIGKVSIGEDVGVWFGSVLRGDNEPITIGARTNIQENCIFHTDPGFPVVVGEGCTIGHGAIVHGCRIGDNSLIGMGATVLNGAVIGGNCMIGAGALVREGAQVPDNALVVGMPGKVIRQLDEDAQAALRSAADHYVARARLYVEALERVG